MDILFWVVIFFYLIVICGAIFFSYLMIKNDEVNLSIVSLYDDNT